MDPYEALSSKAKETNSKDLEVSEMPEEDFKKEGDPHNTDNNI